MPCPWIQIESFTKTSFPTILNGICEVWGCPGAWHGPNEAIPSKFGWVLSYMTQGKSIFMFFWKYWKLTSSPNTSKLVLGPPDWSLVFFKSHGTIPGAIKNNNFPNNDSTQIMLSGNLDNLPTSSFFAKIASFFMHCFGPMEPGHL